MYTKHLSFFALRDALKYELVRRGVLPSHSNIVKIIDI